VSERPRLNRKTVELIVNGRAVVAVIQNPGMWSIVSIDVEGLPRLPPYREESFRSEEETIAKIREIVASYIR
jgi:hypothetical protein